MRGLIQVIEETGFMLKHSTEPYPPLVVLFNFCKSSISFL